MSAADSQTNTGSRFRLSNIRIGALALCMLLALIAANLVYSALARRSHALTGEAGELLHVAGFSGFADEWDLYEGQQSARLIDDQLELSVSALQTATWSAAQPQFADFDFSVQAVASEGPLDNAFGLVFHIRGDRQTGCDLPAVLLCGVEDMLPLAGAAIRQTLDIKQATEYFAFLISSDGYYSLWRTDARGTSILSAWIASDAIRQGLGAENLIRVVAEGRRYRFYVNGAPLALCVPDAPGAASTYAAGECVGGSMQDSYLADTTVGRLGLIAQSTASGGGGVVVRFDNMLVFSPGGIDEREARL
ncbi:MAG: hypothetical protein F4X02_16145 [Chloroflexi bacterium]|nr:hypothetical protein [Chloroflexota bacterium]